jgi:hypothetical protein
MLVLSPPHTPFLTFLQEMERLQKEVTRLHETMTSKAFRAPSAWAEREVKYRQDKKRWEEEGREWALAMETLRAELEMHKAGRKMADMEEKLLVRVSACVCVCWCGCLPAFWRVGAT